jgi:ABC-type transporter MlaC component
MNQKLLLAGLVCLVLAVLVGGGSLAANHWTQHQTKQKADQASAITKAKKAQYDADNAQFDLLSKQYAVVQAECQKGAVAYGLLTSQVLKAKVGTAPVCAAAAVAR